MMIVFLYIYATSVKNIVIVAHKKTFSYLFFFYSQSKVLKFCVRKPNVIYLAIEYLQLCNKSFIFFQINLFFIDCIFLNDIKILFYFRFKCLRGRNTWLQLVKLATIEFSHKTLFTWKCLRWPV